MSGERVLGGAIWKTHMAFLDGQNLVFCVADDTRWHRISCGGDIWTPLDRRPGLRWSLLDVPRTLDASYRP